jgi:hypothetical protein
MVDASSKLQDRINVDDSLATASSRNPRKRKWISLRLFLSLVAVVSLVNLNWPTSYELHAGVQAGQATHLFYSRQLIDSNTPTTAIIGGFPKRYIYAVDLHSDVPEHRQWFSLRALLVDLVLCGSVVGMLIYQAFQMRVPQRRRLNLLDLIIVTSILALFTAWSVERKAVFQFNEKWARSTDSIAKYGTTRIWIGKSLVTSWPLSTSWFNYTYTNAEERIECHRSETYQSILKAVQNPLVERICVIGREAKAPYSVASTLPTASNGLQNTGAQEFTKQGLSFPLLRTLELSNCIIDAELLHWIKRHESLRALRFVHCEIKEIPQDFFQSLPNLVQFENHYSKSEIDLDWSSINECQNLRLLGVCYSTFETIRKVLPGHPSLREIVVWNNYEEFSLPTSPANSGTFERLDNLFGDVQVEFLGSMTNEYFLELSNLPNLEALSLAYDDDLSLQLDELPRLRHIRTWSAHYNFFESNVEDAWIMCSSSKITNCPVLKMNGDLVFRPDSVHRLETIRPGDNLRLLSESRLNFPPSASESESQLSLIDRAKQIEKRMIEFLDRLPDRVLGGGLEIDAPDFERLASKLPLGLQQISLTWQEPPSEITESNSHDSDKKERMVNTNWLPLSREQLASVEAYDSNAPLTEAMVHRLLDEASKLTTLSVNIDAPQLVIRDRPNLTDVCFHSINGEIPPVTCSLGLNFTDVLINLNVEQRPCQLQFLNCPKLREIRSGAVPEGVLELVNLPSLSYCSPLEWRYEEDLKISCLGSTQIESAAFEFEVLCGTLEENCRGWNLLTEVELKGNFAESDIRDFVQQHCKTLKRITFRERRFDLNLTRHLQELGIQRVRWSDGQIDAASFAKLQATNSMEGCWFTSIVLPTEGDLIANNLIDDSHIQIDKFVLQGTTIDDDAAQWIAKNVDAREMDVRQFEGEVAALLPCVAGDNCKLYVSAMQMLDPNLVNAINKYPNLIVNVAREKSQETDWNDLNRIREFLRGSPEEVFDESNTSKTEK